LILSHILLVPYILPQRKIGIVPYPHIMCFSPAFEQ
jgi:hypothetical protein